MNRIIQLTSALVLIFSFGVSTAYAQAPEKMSYQAVVRNVSNNLVTTQAVGMQISILQGGTTGTAVYIETQTPTTNASGLVSLEMGTGTVVSGDFTTIDWSNGPYFIKTETDPTGGSAYTISGTSQLMSIPYALYAKTSGSSIAGPQGAIGATGAASTVAGPQGPIGATGAASTVAGPQGPIGNTGPSGPTGASGANLTMASINFNMTLNTSSQFIVASGTITITLPATPATGQILYFFSDAPINISLNPNGKVFRQGAIDYSTSTMADFGNTNGKALSIIYNGSKWYPLSIN